MALELMDRQQPTPQQPTPVPVQPTAAQVKAAQLMKDIMSGKVKIEGPKPKPKGKAGIAGYLLGGLISKDSVLIGVIVILLLTVIAMTTFVIGATTNPGVNVTFDTQTQSANQGNSTSTQNNETETTNPVDSGQTGSTDNTSTPVTQTTDLVIMMLAKVSDNQGKSFPPETRDIEIGGTTDFKLVPVEVKVDVEQGDELITALEALFGQGDVIYKDLSLTTQLGLSDIAVRVLNDRTGDQIQLSGELVAAGTLSPVYIKSQIEETVEKYTDSYVITLNGSASDYQCFGDESGNCN